MISLWLAMREERQIGLMLDGWKPTAVNGVTNFAELHKGELETAGYNVYVFTWGRAEAEDEAKHIVRSPAFPISNTGYYVNFRPGPKAQQFLEEMDILHVHHPFVSGSIAVRTAKRIGLPIVYTNHTRYDLYAQHYLPWVTRALTKKLIEKHISNFTANCDLVVAPSKNIENVLREMGVSAPITVIPNGIDVESFRVPKEQYSPSALNLPENARFLVYTGRLGPEKNLDLLLQTFAIAGRKFPELNLLLVGEGPEGKRLRRQADEAGIAQQTHFVGKQPYEKVRDYLFIADAFITTSVTEAHPLSILEALAAGLPVLGVDTAGINEVVENEKSGLLAPEEAEALASQVVRLISETDLQAKLSAGARETGERYDIKKTTAEYVKHYESLIEKKNKEPQLR